MVTEGEGKGWWEGDMTGISGGLLSTWSLFCVFLSIGALHVTRQPGIYSSTIFVGVRE